MLNKSIFKNVIAGFIMVILFGVITVLAQSGITVSGTVTDQNGAIIQGATIRLVNLGSNQELSIVSDSTGKYEFTNVGFGSYRLSAATDGFAASAESLTIVSENITQDFSLSPGTIQDVVTVTAGKGLERAASEVPQTVTVATAEQIEQQRPRSTFEVIERAPNIIVRETNPARERPRLRGLDSSRVLIVIDGERLNNARTDLQTGLSPSIIDVTQLDSAEVVSGAGSSLYGSDSLAGTINLVTKSPTRPTDGLNFGLRFDGNYATNGKVRRGNAVINLSNPMVAFRTSGSLFKLENYKIGNRGITQQEVLNFGRYFTTVPASLPNAVTGVFTTNGPNSYPIFSVAENGEVFNGDGNGVNGQFDLWFFPTEKHNFRGRYIGSQHRDLGDAFSGPPYEGAQRSNPFRDYDKFGLRYEALDLSKYIPRIAVNFYRQKLSFPQEDLTYTNAAGGSFSGAAFTGSPSVFTLSTLTENKNTVTTNNIDVQATFAPVAGLLVTAGAQDLKDFSRDEFSNNGFILGDINRPYFGTVPLTRDPITNLVIPTVQPAQRGASSPNTTYEDRAAFFQAEFDRIKYLRLTGGLRVDNWRTKATPSAEFPLGSEFNILTVAQTFLQTDRPLAPQVANLPLLTGLASRTSEVETSRTVLTGSIGAVLRLPYGINPYVRYGTSYREPSITERYILRNFNTGIPGFYALVVGNPGLEPERGRNLDVGVKFQGRNYNGSFGYFRNNLSNLIIFQTPETGNICAPVTPGLQGLAFPFLGCLPGRPLINFNGRINQADNLITGFEGTGQYSFSLGSLGSINPFVSFGTLKGVNKSPTPLNVFRLQNLQSRSNSPLELSGSADDFPLGNITPFRIIGGVQYNDASGRLFAEYSYRHQDRVTRIDPNGLTGTTLVNFGTYASFNSIDKHDVRVGYTIRSGERYRISLNAGIQNFTDRLFWEQFQNAPAPGRSYIFGFTTEFFNLLGK